MDSNERTVERNYREGLVTHPGNWNARYQAILNAEFVEIEGGVFVRAKGSKLKVRNIDSDLFGDPRPIRHAENEENHKHFDFPLGVTPRERFHNNLVLARGTRTAWMAALQRTFPKRRFNLLLANEYTRFYTEDLVKGKLTQILLGAEIIPTLRLWTVNDETPDELIGSIYPLDRMTDDTVIDKDACPVQLCSLKTAFRWLARDWIAAGLPSELQ